MAITFAEISSTRRRPGALAEIRVNNTRRGLPVFPFNVLMIGQELASGTAPAGVPLRVVSEAEAVPLFGRGSMLHQMVRRFRQNNQTTQLTVLPLADEGAGVAAQGTIAVSGTATEAGTINLYVGGYPVRVGVASGAAAAAIATAIGAAVNALPDLPVTATVSTTTVTLTARHKGQQGNDIDLRVNYYGLPDEKTPAGLTLTLTAIGTATAGTTNPSLATVFGTLPDVDRYDVMIMPYSDTSNIAALKAELDDRWLAGKALDGVAILARPGTYSANVTFTDALNHRNLSVLPYTDSPSLSWEWAAALAGQVAASAENDPAIPLSDLPLLGILPPVDASRYLDAQREGLLYAGASTFIVDAGTVKTEYLVTSYQTNAGGQDDTSYLDLEDRFIDAYVRRVFNSNASQFRRYKLADNGFPTRGGQTVMTPRLFEGYMAAWAQQLYEAAIIDGLETTLDELYAERDGSNTSRLNYYFPYKRMGQLRLIAGVLAFEG